MQALNFIGRYADRRAHAILALLLLSSLVALLVIAWNAPPEDHGPDGRLYESRGYRASQATDILACGNFGHAFWSPAWISTIAVIYRTFGRHPELIRVFLVILAVLTGLLVFLLTSRVAGRRAALAAVALFLSAKLTHIYTVYYHYEIPLAFLLALAGVLILIPWSPRAGGGDREGRASLPEVVRLFLAGLVIASAGLISPRVFLLAPAAVGVLWLQGGRAQLIRAGLPLMVGILAIEVPWVIRNYACFGEWIPGTTNGGYVLYFGNNAHSPGGFYVPSGGQLPDHALWESRAWARDALAYMAAHPGQTLIRSLAKGVSAWNPIYVDQFLLHAAFALGWIRFLRNRKSLFDARVLWILSVPIAFTVLQMIFFHSARFMVPALPYIAIVAGAGLVGWRNRESGEDAVRLSTEAALR
jgi:hypothetical protein